LLQASCLHLHGELLRMRHRPSTLPDLLHQHLLLLLWVNCMSCSPCKARLQEMSVEVGWCAGHSCRNWPTGGYVHTPICLVLRLLLVVLPVAGGGAIAWALVCCCWLLLHKGLGCNDKVTDL
jgi:hypothetical protein